MIYILAGDIQNTYLNTSTKEKLFFYAGDEYKSDQGKVVVIVRALHGLNSCTLEWINHLYEILGNHLGFQSSLTYTEVWFKAAIYKARNEYYTYILVYDDDLLTVYKYPQKYITMLESNYTVKSYSIWEPKVYFVSNVGKVLYGNGSYTWIMISDSYFKEAIKNVEKRLKEDGLEYNKNISDINYLPKNAFS